MNIGPFSSHQMKFAVVEKGVFLPGGGVLGLGLDTAEFPQHGSGHYYRDFLDHLRDEGIISRRAFAIALHNQGWSPYIMFRVLNLIVYSWSLVRYPYAGRLRRLKAGQS